MRICNYSLGNNYDKFGRIESNQIILARPGKRVLGVINGVNPDSCRVEINLNNTWVLDFDVDRIVDGGICNFYDRIEQKMELHLPGYGWFKITEEPIMSNNGNYETLSVHAESLEIEFQQYVLKGFECNTGSTASLEYFATDNTYYLDDNGEEFLPEYDDGTYYPLFRENVRFYRDTTLWETMMTAFANTDGSEQALLSMVGNYPVIMDSWRINYNLDNFDNAIQYAIDHGDINNQSKRILRSYLGKVTDQQTAYNLAHVYTDILTYITNPSNSMVVDINYKSYDFNHREDYTLAEIIDLELQRQKDLSLLDFIADHYGWRVGFVDDSVVADSDVEDDRIPLSQKTGSFQVDSQNAYTFMTQEMASYFRCVFVFDSYEKTVNAYNINNIGIDTDIFLSFHNIQNSVERSGNDVIRTAFYIQGGEDLKPIEANFGSNEIWDLSYYMNTKHFAQATIDKYNAWLEYRESQRQSYMDKTVEYLDQLEVVSELNDRVPVDSSDNTQYSTMSDEELLEEKAKNEALVAGIESRYVDGNDDFDIDILRENDPLVYQEYLIITGSVLSSPLDALEYLVFDANAGDGDYGDYVFVNGNEDTSDYRLGNIDTTIFNRKIINGGFIDDGDSSATIQAKNYYKHQKQYLDDYLYDFDTYGDAYGVAELQNRLDDLENKYTTLWTRGYGQPSETDDENNPTDPNHEEQYQLYLKYKNAYDKCKQVLQERTDEYNDAKDDLQGIADDMLDIARDVDITNNQFEFTQDELDLINKYLYYTDYVNENMITTSIYTNEEIVETEYQLIKDAQEELYAVAHPQWIWNTTQDNLFMIVDNDDWYGNIPHPTIYEDWRNDLMIGNYIHVGFREDDHLPDFVYVDSSSNQVKLRLITIGLNPFMIEPTIDLTFSSMIQYKSRRNDFVDLLGLASGVGDHQVTATFQSRKLDGTFEIDSSFIMKLLKNGAFQNYAAGSILNGGTLDSLVVPTIYATNINVDQITGNIARFMETYTQYLDADTIVTRVITADNGYFQSLVANTINATEGQIIHLTSTNASIDAGYVTSLVAGRLSVAQLAAGDLTLSNSMKIVSENGFLEMDGQHLIISIEDENENLIDGIQLGYGDSTLPFLKFCAPDSNGNQFTGIQLGYASNGLPNLIIRDENGNDGIVIGLNSIASGSSSVIKPSITIYDDDGAALFTSRGVAADSTVTGVQAAAISNGLIVNDMVHTQTLSKDRMNFNVMEVGDDIIIEQMTYTDGSKFGTEYTTFEQNITNAVAEFVDVLPSVELTGKQTFTVDEDSNILPSKITIYANPRNGFIPYVWTIDGVDASQYVSSDGLSIDIPNTVMVNTSISVDSGDAIERDYIVDSFGHGVPEGYSGGLGYLDLDTLIVYLVTIVQEEDVETGEVTSTDYEWSIYDVLVPSPVEAKIYSLQFGLNSNILYFRYSNNIFVQIDPLSNSKVVRCQNQNNSSYDTITLYKLPSYNSAITTIILDNDVVQFATSANGVPMFRQTATSKITVYNGSERLYNFTLNNVVAPTGITATASTDSIEIVVSPTAAISNTSTITFDVVIGNSAISKSITVNRLISNNSETTIVEYTLQPSNLECADDAVWTEIRPVPSAGEFLWYRYRTDYSNGNPTKYSKPHYISTIAGLINMTDAVNKSITNKIWQDDFETYDTQVIRHRESEITQTVDEISMRVSETSSDLGTLSSEYSQTVGEIRMTISNISDDIDALSDSQGQTASDLLDLIGDYQDTVADFNNLHSNYQDTVAALNNLSSDYTDTANQFIALRTEYDQTIDSINTTITGVTTDFDAFSSSVTQSVGEISSTVTSISGDLLALSGQYQGTVSDLATLLQNYSGTVQALTSLTDNYNQTVQDFGVLSTTVTQGFGEINSTVSALSGDLTSLNSNYQQTAQALSTLNNNFASLSNRYNQTVDDFAILSSSIDQRFDSINLTVAGLSDNISDLDEQYSENIQNLSDTININYAQALNAVQNLRTDTDVEFLAVRSDFRVELGQISSTVTGITTDLDALSTSYTQTAQDFSWLFAKSDPTDPTSGMVLTSDGLNLFNSSITVTNLIDSIAEGALQVRSTNSGSISTDSNEPLQNDQSQTLDATGYTTLYFDNGYPDSSPHRSENPWISFLGHKIEANPFSVELSDAIINSTTQFVVYKTGNPFDHQYVVWYDKEMRYWKSICINEEINLMVASPSTNRYEITPTQDGDLHVVFRYNGDIVGHRIHFNRHNFDISGTLTYGYQNGDINQYPYNLIQGHYGFIVSEQATDYIILEFTIPSAVKNTTYGLYARIQDMSGGSDKPFDVITCTQAAGYGSATNWEWDNDSHMVVAEFTKESDGDVYYQSYYPAKTYQGVQQVAMLQMWGIDGVLTETTTINGGSIQTDTIDSLAIKTEGIQSREYHETPDSTMSDDYLFIPIASEEQIMLEQNSNTSFTITPEEDGRVTVILRYTGNVIGDTFYYSTDYQGDDLSISGGYTSSGDNTEIMFEEPQNSGYYVFDDSTDSFVLYITFYSAQQGVPFNLNVYLSDGTIQKYFNTLNSSITCNEYNVGETYRVYTDAEIADNNVITFTFNGNANEETLYLLAQDINPNNVVSAELICYFGSAGSISQTRVELTSNAAGYLSYDYNIPSNINIMNKMTLTLVIDNLNSNQQYTIESHITNGSEYELWNSVIYNNSQLEKIPLDPIYSDTGTWFNLADSGFIRSKNFSIDADGNAYFKGELQAASGTFSGDITANAGHIGGSSGWVIATNKIYSGTVDGGTSSGDITLSTVDFRRRINQIERTNLRFAIGENFGIKNDGTLYANNVDITGTIHATGGTFSGELQAAGGSFEGVFSHISQFGIEVRIGGRDWDNVLRPFFLMDETKQYAVLMAPATVTSIYRDGNHIEHTCSLTYDGVYTSSDIRLKKDITDIGPDIGKRLHPVSFQFKSNNQNKTGFIAQEVQQVLPNAVREDSNGYLLINYQELIAPLFALVHEHEERIVKLEKTITELKETIEKLYEKPQITK